MNKNAKTPTYGISFRIHEVISYFIRMSRKLYVCRKYYMHFPRHSIDEEHTCSLTFNNVSTISCFILNALGFSLSSLKSNKKRLNFFLKNLMKIFKNLNISLFHM